MRVFRPIVSRLEAKRNIRGLSKALDDKDDCVRSEAAKALARIGEDSILILIALLKDKRHLPQDFQDRQDRFGHTVSYTIMPVRGGGLLDIFGVSTAPAIKVLVEIGASSVPALLEALEDSNPHIRANMICALGSIGPNAVYAVPTLIEMLRATESYVRMNAVSALGEIGPGAQEAVPYLVEFMEDTDSSLEESWRSNAPNPFAPPGIDFQTEFLDASSYTHTHSYTYSYFFSYTYTYTYTYAYAYAYSFH